MKRLLSILLMLLLCVPAATAESTPYYVNGGDADRVHLRAEPSTQAESLGLYYTGTQAHIYRQSGMWAYVTIGGANGWMMTSYLVPDEPAHLGPWKTVNGQAELWAAPTNQSELLTCLDNGTAVHILGETADGWSYVECGGRKGYMATDGLSSMQDAKAFQRTTIVAEGMNGYIHRYTAPNGQELYFNAYEEVPIFEMKDVNFDGMEDLVVITGRWAKCDTVLFYVYDPAEGYVLVCETARDEGLMNYVLYPEYGLVGTSIANGNAGLLHITNLYRWEGNQLKLIRSAVSDEWEESSFVGETYTSIIHGDILHVTVRDHTNGYEDAVIYERIIPMDDADYQRIYDEEMEALWQGLK